MLSKFNKLLLVLWSCTVSFVAMAVTTPYPIMFVTQVPIPYDFISINATFGNHNNQLYLSGRGGDLWIRYPTGKLKNLTAAAGFGSDGLQGANAIVVRDPTVHWSGTKAIFSMMVGAPSKQYEVLNYYWQLYEITGLGENDKPVISKVPKQPAFYNNINPIYGSDDQIIFSSDRPRNGLRHLYPQLDEYESQATNTGLWRLNPRNGQLSLLTHAPSGDFSPILDSYGRVVFTRWDHLLRDQFADDDSLGTGEHGSFNFANESKTAKRLSLREELFPEPLHERTDLLVNTPFNGHYFNHFLPWQILEDGSELEILNHIGRHEFQEYFDRARNDDPNITEMNGVLSSRKNKNPISNFFQISEDPNKPGLYYGVNAPEFETHASGQIVSFTGQPTVNPDNMTVKYITHRTTASVVEEGKPNPLNHSGFYRDPLVLTNGSLVAAHTVQTRKEKNIGTRKNPVSRYQFRLKTLSNTGGVFKPKNLLTSGIKKSVKYWDPDELVSYSGILWELQPTEVKQRTPPKLLFAELPTPEQSILDALKINITDLKKYLQQRNLALIVTRNSTTRDRNDRQQPFNLRVLGGKAVTRGAPGKMYDIAYLQLFQADQLRGYGGVAKPRPGRRVLATPLHDARLYNPDNPNGPKGSVKIATDGSIAVIVPARRALTWHVTDGQGNSVVKERNWLSFQPGEIRSCPSCHGVNTTDQAGHLPPTNPPEALKTLLKFLQTKGL